MTTAAAPTSPALRLFGRPKRIVVWQAAHRGLDPRRSTPEAGLSTRDDATEEDEKISAGEMIRHVVTTAAVILACWTLHKLAF